MLVGQGIASGVSGPKVFDLVVEAGQNLDFSAGEPVCIGLPKVAQPITCGPRPMVHWAIPLLGVIQQT